MTPNAPASTPGPDQAVADRAFFGHPRGLRLIFVAEMWERFSYYGMRAILVLYLVNDQRWTTAEAAGLYGTYTSLVYLTPLLGGYLADRWLGTSRSLVLGGIVIAAGHFTLAFSGLAAFYTGLGLIVAGTGLFKSNSATMVGQLYREGDPRRDSGFTLYYMGVNLGAFIGPLVVGYLAQTPRFGWHWGFAAAGVGMVLGLLAYLRGRDRTLSGVGLPPAPRAATEREHAAPEGRQILEGAAGSAAGLVLVALLAGPSPLGLAMGAIIGAALGITVLGTHGEERRRVLAIFLGAFFVVFFWMAYEQAGSSMNLFADKYTDLRVLGWTVPSSWFQAVNSTFILVLAIPFTWLWAALARRRREPSTPAKMVWGLALLGAGFLFLVEGGRRADGGALVSPLWLVLAYFLHTLGELCLSPVGLSYVSKIAPARFASLLMGAWYLANAAANKLGGALASFTPMPGEVRTPAGGLAGALQRVSATNQGFFSIFAVSSLVAAVLLFLCVPLLRRLTASVKA